jgi:hypothetical protein
VVDNKARIKSVSVIVVDNATSHNTPTPSSQKKTHFTSAMMATLTQSAPQPTPPTAATPPTNLQTALAIGLEVDIEARTYPGINKQGGHGKVTKLHTNPTTGLVNKVDVKYVLGGGEKEVELTYVKVHVELERGGRSRRERRVMNLDSLGGDETRKTQGTGGAQGKHGKGKENGVNPPNNGVESEASVVVGSVRKAKKNDKRKRSVLAMLDENSTKKNKGEQETARETVVDSVEISHYKDGDWVMIKVSLITVWRLQKHILCSLFHSSHSFISNRMAK